MRTFKINAQGIGAAIGLLLVNGIVYLIFHRTPASEEEINAYIQNSEVVELTDFTFFYCCPIKPLYTAISSLNPAEIGMISSYFKFQAPLE